MLFGWAKRRQVATTTISLEDVDVVCTHCGVSMTMHQGSGSRVRYFHCAKCQRWVSSTYADVLKADVKMRTQPRAQVGPSAGGEAVKERLESWLGQLDQQDPYLLLGVLPSDSPERVRERYRKLALLAHPDRGGSPEKMRELNVAYEQVLDQAQRRRAAAASATARAA